MRIAPIALLVALAAACGTENNDANNANAANNTTPNQSTGNNNTAGTNNANNQTANNNTSPNNANNVAPNNSDNSANARTEPYITRFAYYVEDESIGSNAGFTVSVLSGDIANTDGNTRTMTAEDAAGFESMFLGADTIAKMRDGWNCPAPMTNEDMGPDAGMDTGPSTDGALHFFEARIQDGETIREVEDVTGCVVSGDPDVTAIVEAINTLGARYL